MVSAPHRVYQPLPSPSTMSRRPHRCVYTGRLGFLHYRIVNLMAAATVCAALIMMTAPTARAASPAETAVRSAINSMKALPATDGRPAARRILLDSIDNALALDLIAKQALGPQWDKLGTQERRRFVTIFTESLEKLAFPRAAAALSQVKVSYLGVEKKASAEMVRTTIANDDGGKVPLDFTVARRGSRWQIIDVTMDGASIAKAVSTRIQNAVQTEGYQKLVEELQMQISKADAGS